jgi:hypothetical protein
MRSATVNDELRSLASLSGVGPIDPAVLEHLLELIAFGVPARDVVNYLRAVCSAPAPVQPRGAATAGAALAR